MEKLLFYLIAVLPGLAIAAYIYFRDKNEPEPIKLILFSFLLGLICFGVNTLLDSSLTSLGVGMGSLIARAFIEEVCIFLVMRLVIYPNKNFNEPLDGIVYTVMVAMGFAAAKNIYLINTSGDSHLILPMLTTIIAHAAYAALMGYLLGKAKFMKQNESWYVIAALVFATLFHIVYDVVQLLSAMSGMWIGTAAALIIIIVLSKQAIDTYQKASTLKG